MEVGKCDAFALQGIKYAGEGGDRQNLRQCGRIDDLIVLNSNFAFYWSTRLIVMDGRVEHQTAADNIVINIERPGDGAGIV